MVTFGLKQWWFWHRGKDWSTLLSYGVTKTQKSTRSNRLVTSSTKTATPRLNRIRPNRIREKPLRLPQIQNKILLYDAWFLYDIFEINKFLFVYTWGYTRDCAMVWLDSTDPTAESEKELSEPYFLNSLSHKSRDVNLIWIGVPKRQSGQSSCSSPITDNPPVTSSSLSEISSIFSSVVRRSNCRAEIELSDFSSLSSIWSVFLARLKTHFRQK